MNTTASFRKKKEDEATIPEPKEDAIIVLAHNRKKRGRKSVPDSLPRVNLVLDIDETDKNCECGTP